MEMKQNKFLMAFAALTLLSTVIFFTYVIFITTEANKPKVNKTKEDLNISITGSIDNTITINSTTWDSVELAQTNPYISKIDFLVDTTNSTTTNATYTLVLNLIDIEEGIDLTNVKWKLYNKNNLEKEIFHGDFSKITDNKKINVSNVIPIQYGGNVDEYKLYIYLDKNPLTKEEEKIEFKAKLSVDTNK